MLSDCNWVNQAQLKHPWSFYSDTCHSDGVCQLTVQLLDLFRAVENLWCHYLGSHPPYGPKNVSGCVDTFASKLLTYLGGAKVTYLKRY